MNQKEYVINAMKENGGYATFQKLNNTIDFSEWGTKTPYASVRRIVQTNKDFFRIQPGLWGLVDKKQEILHRLNIRENDKKSITDFTHGYIQGIIAEIGNIKKYTTYIPPQDKNRLFLERKLSEIASICKIYDFTYPEILKFAKTVDVIWFNKRNMPNSFYEVEHTTDIKNSLDKFYELQDYRAKFYIVAANDRKKQYDELIKKSIYCDIKDIVTFVSYDTIIQQYEKESILVYGGI